VDCGGFDDNGGLKRREYNGLSLERGRCIGFGEVRRWWFGLGFGEIMRRG
jgi:hypothetical protein